MADPSECKSIDVTHTPFHMAFKPDGDLFTWYQEPSNATRWARFNAAMRGSLNASPMNILSGKLPSNALILILTLMPSSFQLEVGD
jgi:hypothetical protein